MKQKEWNRRIELNLEGVQMLGAALFIGSKNRLAEAREALCLRQTFGGAAKDKWLQGAEHHGPGADNQENEHQNLERKVKGLNIPDHVFDAAKSLRISDFRFRWDHLRDHPILVGFLANEQPDFARNWGQTTPIIDRQEDNVIGALRAIFLSEILRLERPHLQGVPELRHESDFLFYLTVWKLCEVESGPGQPKGRRWPDGSSEAASHAYSLHKQAREAGSPISKEEAIRRSLTKFEIVSSTEFDTHPHKSNVIVSDALGEQGRKAGAIQTVRKLFPTNSNE